MFDKIWRILFVLISKQIWPWDIHELLYAWKTNKCTNYSFNLLIKYGSSYMFRHYIATFRERS
jgi:uncharacterized membrane protein (DUF2068 family)